ncbi:hypothetical protein [Mycolicibacterium sphagni]|uniref:Antitoxin Xre/MbcA/ParS-like toxin-binding domain-containing protein n=1 Tax=Mycolicibacterium sphagni TaxID=1786 RepID=A0A255DMG7_9MYCO|nr:hypothetical protein [Mycolicibacterium sphagni]OYN80444.1 hypothetical protein CG716_10000 [Mycolicibacterium sphagni]
MSQLAERYYDHCECGHIRWQHVAKTCRALDSYNIPCSCNGFEPQIHECVEAPHDIVKALGEVYKPDGILSWLRSRNRNLQNYTPLELLGNGSEDRVRAEVERLVGGAW